MKFTDGFWQMKPGVAPHYPVHVRDVSVSDDVVTLYAATTPIDHRGQTLNRSMITYEISAPMADVIRVKFYHHKGGADPMTFVDRRGALVCEMDDIQATITSGDTRVVVTFAPFGMTFYYKNKRITDSGARHAAYIDAPDGHYMREMLTLDVDECVYGLGERFTPFVKNGQVVEMWNEDGGTCSDIAYKNVPFYMTNHGYGVLVNSPAKVSFEVASEVVSRVGFSLPGEVMDYCVIGGGNPKNVLSNYTALTGRAPLTPAWSYGLWLTTSFTTNYDEGTVMSFVDKMAEYGIPLRTFHFDCFWMKEFTWCDFVWDEKVFPDPCGMLKRMHEKGLNICVWINPYIAQKSYMFDEGKANGYLLKRPDGSVWQWDMWQAGMGLVDFTNPDATAWYCEKLQQLIDMGVDCFKTDFGERIPTDVTYFDGSDPLEMHNYYTHLYNKAVFDLLLRNFGEGQAVLFARSATAGGQVFPVHWGGDCVSKYTSMAESLRGGLSLVSSGFAYWSHDISGFEDKATPDLYKRWAAFGLLSTHSRLHGSSSYRVPWLFDEEACAVVKAFTDLKHRLMPYIFAASVEAATKGYPVMRAMFMEFPGDRLCDTLDKQYMLGENLLVAPIFNENGIAKYYLPKGTWTDILTGKQYIGRDFVEETVDYFHIPLLARGNSIIPFGAVEDKPDYDYGEGVTFHAYEVTDAKCDVYDMDGVLDISISGKRQGDQLLFKAHNPNKRRFIVIVNGECIEPSADEFAVEV